MRDVMFARWMFQAAECPQAMWIYELIVSIAKNHADEMRAAMSDHAELSTDSFFNYKYGWLYFLLLLIIYKSI